MQTKPTVIALGFFDGVHLGHGALLQRVKEAADTLDAEPMAFTFDESPTAALTGQKVPLLSAVWERSRLMSQLYGIRSVLIAPFRTIQSMDWEVFIQDYLVKEHGVVHIVAGHDFRFGFRGEGNPQRLREKCAALGVGCDIIPKVELEGVTISSTYIRSLIAQGEMERAVQFLGHPFCLTDTVRHGKRLGSALGFPTVNLRLPEGVILPAFGVYATRVWVLPDYPDYQPHVPGEGPYPAVTNVGVRPTVADGDQVTVEGFLLDFDGDLYGRTVRMEFFQYLRPERKFPSLEDLSAEVRRNVQQTREYFA